MRSLLIAGIVAALVPQLAAAQGADPAAGEKRFSANCVNCHGRTGKGLAEFPAIAGRDADYITKRLTQYRNKEQIGYNSAVMFSLAGELSNDDITNIAAYVSATFK